MSKPNRTEFEINRDRAIIADLYLKGWSYTAIADKLGITRDMVAYDLDKIRGEWAQSALMDFDKARAAELARVDKLEATFWDAWERSCKGKKKTIQKQYNTTNPGGGTGSQTSAAVESQETIGDPRFLNGIMTCIERRCRILGLDISERTKGTEAGPAGANGPVIFLPSFDSTQKAPPPKEEVATETKTAV